MSIRVREARAGDGPHLHRLIVEMAEHHGEGDHVTSTPDDVEAALCNRSKAHGCFVAVDENDEPVGLAYWYVVVTTFTCKPKLYLEDIVVDQEVRGTGAGFMLMQAVAQMCVEKGYKRFEWLAMDNNDEGNAFYRRVGGQVREGAVTWQLWEDGIKALAEA